MKQAPRLHIYFLTHPKPKSRDMATKGNKKNQIQCRFQLQVQHSLVVLGMLRLPSTVAMYGRVTAVGGSRHLQVTKSRCIFRKVSWLILIEG